MSIGYKNKYSGIFVLDYLVQGVNQSMVVFVLPIYLLTTKGSVEANILAFMVSLFLLPASIKFIYGILTDRYGFKKIGNRKSWIIFPDGFSAIFWILLPFFLLLGNIDPIIVFLVCGLLISFGVFISDTALDALIIDVCPREQLARVQGYCWSGRSVGIIVGGPLLLFIFVYIPFYLIFIGVGIMTILFTMLLLIVKERDPIEYDIGLIKWFKKELGPIFEKRENWKLFAYCLIISIYGVIIMIILPLYILIQSGLVDAEGATISSIAVDINLYRPQAIITTVLSIGIISGSILGGYITDKRTRRFGAIFTLLLSIISTILIVLSFNIIFLLIITIFAGMSVGSFNSVLSALAGEYSKKHSETRGTFFATGMSFSNFGSSIGLFLAGFLFIQISNITTEVKVIYGAIFLIILLISLLQLIPLLTMDRKQYELD